MKARISRLKRIEDEENMYLKKIKKHFKNIHVKSIYIMCLKFLLKITTKHKVETATNRKNL